MHLKDGAKQAFRHHLPMVWNAWKDYLRSHTWLPCGPTVDDSAIGGIAIRIALFAIWVAAFLALAYLPLRQVSAADLIETPPPPADCPSDADTLKSIATDMQRGSEEHPHGVIGKSYGDRPRLNMGNDPRGFVAIQGWGQLYASDRAGTDRPAAVELKDMRVYMLERSTHRWKLMQASIGVSGAAYREDFAGDDHVLARIYRAADGGSIATLIPGRNFHFWTTSGRATIDPGDVAGLLVIMRARLVPDPGAVADEDWRGAHYVLSVGVDYWRDKSVAWHEWKTNEDAGIGRFKRVLPCWRDFTMTTLSAAQLAADPPPLN